MDFGGAKFANPFLGRLTQPPVRVGWRSVNGAKIARAWNGIHQQFKRRRNPAKKIAARPAKGNTRQSQMNEQPTPEVKPPDEAAMSVYSRIVRADISHGAFRLWHLLRDHMNNDSGLAWPAQETISKLMRCKVHSIKGWTNELVQAGFLKVERRGQRHFLVYSFPVVLPKWAERENSRPAPMGNATNLGMPKGAWPRPAPMGRQTESKEPIIPISNSRLLEKRIPAPPEYMTDGYISEKIARNKNLSQELRRGTTRLCLELNELYLLNDSRARELVSDAMEKSNPGAWLNKAVTNELGTKTTELKPETAASNFPRRPFPRRPDRNMGTFHYGKPTDDLKSKVR